MRGDPAVYEQDGGDDPGRPIYYATTWVLAGRAMGVLAATYDGRPTKIEGNPLHPNSLGATDVFAQGVGA